MEKEFSKNWKGSKRPGKQRKYIAKAPLHLKKKFVSANLAKDLRKKHNMRSIPVRKGDTVKVMRGTHKGKKGKITEVMLKVSRIYVEGVQVKKRDGSKVDVKLRPSNVQVLELNLTDKKRLGTEAVKKATESEKNKEKK